MNLHVHASIGLNNPLEVLQMTRPVTYQGNQKTELAPIRVSIAHTHVLKFNVPKATLPLNRSAADSPSLFDLLKKADRITA
jgi:hypothetical protein